MVAPRYARTLFITVVLLLNVGCDQLSKRIVRHAVELHEEIPLAGSAVTLTRVENAGAFLSLGDGLPEWLRVLLLIALPLVMLTFMVLYLFAKTDMSLLGATSIGFVAGGGIGNIYDRIMFGSVTDFLHIDVGWFETGIFNMADVSIMTGAVMILADLYVGREVRSHV